MLYNDAYGAFAGNRHPGILGMPVLEAWPEAADLNSHVMAIGMAGGCGRYWRSSRDACPLAATGQNGTAMRL
jgi:hypothetical protein